MLGADWLLISGVVHVGDIPVVWNIVRERDGDLYCRDYYQPADLMSPAFRMGGIACFALG